MSQRATSFRYLERAERDAIFISARDGTASIVECRCYGQTRWYVGTDAEPLKGSTRHDESKHQLLSTWRHGRRTAPPA